MSGLRLQNVGYAYEQFSLQNISLQLDKGEVGAIVGTSGSGKSTILKLISGFLKPNAGEIFINNQSIASAKTALAPHKRKVGLVFQHHALFPHLSVEDNILYGCAKVGAARTKILKKLLQDFQISHLQKSYPHQISGGEQQRVALARALAAEPSVLLMDEPFASLDGVLRRKIRTECFELLKKAGVTILVITHDAEEAMEISDKIFVVDDGKLIQQGNAHEVYFHPLSEKVAGLFGEINAIHDPQTIATLTRIESESLLIRPEALTISSGANAVEGEITAMQFRGNHMMLFIKTPNNTMLKVHTHKFDYEKGQSVSVRIA